MSETTWQKACDCKGALATSGRTTCKEIGAPVGLLKFEVTTNPGPVCDSCDTPWLLTARRA